MRDTSNCKFNELYLPKQYKLNRFYDKTPPGFNRISGFVTPGSKFLLKLKYSRIERDCNQIAPINVNVRLTLNTNLLNKIQIY